MRHRQRLSEVAAGDQLSARQGEISPGDVEAVYPGRACGPGICEPQDPADDEIECRAARHYSGLYLGSGDKAAIGPELLIGSSRHSERNDGGAAAVNIEAVVGGAVVIVDPERKFAGCDSGWGQLDVVNEVAGGET